MEPASRYCHYWMHCGIVQTAIYILCSFLKPFLGPIIADNGWSVICHFLQLWQWPNHLPKRLHMLLSGKHAAKCQQNKQFQCQGSEAVGLLPVLVHLVIFFSASKAKLVLHVLTSWIWSMVVKCGVFAPRWHCNNQLRIL